MTAVRYPIPGEKTDVVQPMDPAKLERAIAHSTRLIEAHKAKRPHHTDIPALTAWAQDMDLLRSNLQLLEGQRAIGWRDVPPPKFKPQPKPLPARPAPSMEIPVNDPKQTLQDVLAEIKEATARAANAFDRPTFRTLYQRVNNLRHKAREIAKKHDLGEPEFPDLPVNPFAEQLPMPTLTAAPRSMPPLLEGRAKRELDPAPEKAGPGPYREPTAEDLRALLPVTDQAGPADPMAFLDGPEFAPLPPLPTPEDPAPTFAHEILAQPIGSKLHVQLDLTPALRQMLREAVALVPGWVVPVMEELARAREEYPTAEHRTLSLLKEAGQVCKAVMDLHNGKPGATREALGAEIIQTMAMCVRLLEEGDPAVLGEEVA
jgi:hypothetical protein